MNKKALMVGFALGWVANMIARTSIYVNTEEDYEDAHISILSISFALER